MTPRPEYPRPHFDRSSAWLTLNGEWDFAPDPGDVGVAEGWHADAGRTWPARITVPFPWEHPASGVEAHWLPVGWYRRHVRRPVGWSGQRTILHCGAVHHTAEVWVDGRHAGRHVGGYLPFDLDITDLLDTAGEAVVVIRVEAPLDKREIPHGKQRSLPVDDYDGCAFTPSSGIWQPVWLEPRPATYIEGLHLRATPDLTGIEATVEVAGPDADSATVTLTAAGLVTQLSTTDGSVVLPIPNPRPWSPADPHLYPVAAVLTSPAGRDEVTGYTGLRRVDWHDRLLHLNGAPLYLRGVLDQGFWPEGGHTAPTDEALRRDLELARTAGFTLVRKHLKLEDPRWLYWADRLGVLVWAEPPSTGRYTPAATAAFEDALSGMVARDSNHPSIVIWGAYNEEWGLDWDVPTDPGKQEAVRRAYRTLRQADPTRPVVDNSGWAHVETDLVDWHYYDEDPTSWARVVARLTSGDNDFPVRLGPDHTVVKRIGAPGFVDTGQPWLNGEYGGGSTSVERGWHLRWQTQELRRYDRIAGYIYTELYDIEHETAGVYTYHRGNKDLGGAEPAHIHADTTLVVDLSPIAPGADLAAAAAGRLDVRVRVSHHGHHPLDGVLHWALAGLDGGAQPISAKPYVLTEPVTVSAVLPARVGRTRLRLWVSAGERTVAAAFVDIAPPS